MHFSLEVKYIPVQEDLQDQGSLQDTDNDIHRDQGALK